MKTALALIFFAASAFAQDAAAAAHSQASCGPPNVQFEAQTSASQPTAQPEPGKALVYVAEDFRGKGLGSDPTIRIGMDGAWLGATRASSYLSFAVEPGDHHLCTTWQSRLQRLSKLAAFVGFTAEPGKVYYFRARITYSGFGGRTGAMDLDLDPVNPDEGQFLVTSYQPSASHPKK